MSISTLLDIYPFKIIMASTYLVQILLLLFIQYSVHSKAAYLIVVGLSFACDGVMGSVVPTIAIEIFGHKRGHEVYSYLFSNFGLMSVFSALIVSVCLSYIGYNGVFMFCLVCTIISFILAMSIDTKKKFDYIAL